MYIQCDPICYSNRNKYADKGSPIKLCSEKQYNNISEEPMYPEDCYVKLEEDTIDNTINKYQLINENGTYTYTRDLLELEQKRPAIPPLLPILGRTITSPLVVHNWSAALENHPDQEFVHYILQGLTQGFHIGFARELKCRSAKNNMKSALQNPDPVEKYLAEELQAGRVVGPLDFE